MATFTIPSNANDGYIRTDASSITVSSSTMRLGQYPSAGYSANPFWLFSNITIPKNSTINSAYITITATSSTAGGTGSLRMYTVLEDNATSPTTYAEYLAKTRSTEYVSWTPPDFVYLSTYNTPDLSTIIQVIVDRAGWTSGNSMLFQLININFNSSRLSSQVDGSYDPILTVTWTEPVGGASFTQKVVMF